MKLEDYFKLGLIKSEDLVYNDIIDNKEVMVFRYTPDLYRVFVANDDYGALAKEPTKEVLTPIVRESRQFLNAKILAVQRNSDEKSFIIGDIVEQGTIDAFYPFNNEMRVHVIPNNKGDAEYFSLAEI